MSPTSSSSQTSPSTGISRGRRWTDASSAARTATGRGVEFGTLGEVNVNNLGLFFQDAWTVNNKLTLNLGIRTEREDVPSYRENLNGIEFSFADKLAPRAGFAYDVAGDGKWKIYGSWGVFYDTMKLELPRGAFGGDVWDEEYYTLDTLDWNLILATGADGLKPGRFLEVVDFRIPSNDPSCPECGAIDPDLKPFKQQEFVAGIDHEISPRVAVSARYVHKQVDRAIEDVGVIVPGVGEVFFIANPGEGTATTINADDCPTCPGLPEIRRDYDALELKLNKRFSDNWQFLGSYTFARLDGNYPGLASSDEIARVSPNVTRLFDGLVMAFDQNGQPVYGGLNTERPHQIKLLGSYHAAHTHHPVRCLPRGKRNSDHAASEHDQLAPGFLPRTPERRPHAVVVRVRSEPSSRTSHSEAVSVVR